MEKPRFTKENAGRKDNSVPTVGMQRLEGFLHLPPKSRLQSVIPAVPQPNNRAAIFLDRDGVINEDVSYISSLSQLKIMPDVPSALHALQSKFILIVVTNQSGIARGLFTEDTLFLIHSEMVSRLSDEGVTIDALYFCPHLPNAPLKIYDMNCKCRKPNSGMLIEAKNRWGIDLDKSYMIGDRASDIEAGWSAGVKCISIGDCEKPLSHPVQIAGNLLDAANMILDSRSSVSTTG